MWTSEAKAIGAMWNLFPFVELFAKLDADALHVLVVIIICDKLHAFSRCLLVLHLKVEKMQYWI